MLRQHIKDGTSIGRGALRAVNKGELVSDEAIIAMVRWCLGKCCLGKSIFFRVCVSARERVRPKVHFKIMLGI